MVDQIKNVVAKRMANEIFTNELKTGSIIYSNEEIMSKYHCSQAEVDSGLIELIKKGYLHKNESDQLVVSDWQYDGTLAILRDQIELGFFRRDTLKSLNEARMLIEMDCIKIVSVRCPQEYIDKFLELIKLQEDTEDFDDRVKYEFLFHRYIVLATGNVVYPLILNTFESCAYKIAYNYFLNDVNYIKSKKARKKIINYIIKKDAVNAQKELFHVLIECELGIYNFYNNKIINGRFEE